MNAWERVQDTQRVLDRMAEAPKQVMEKLDPAEREELVRELNSLAKQATEVRNGSDLVLLVTAIRRLIISTPALDNQFPITVMRGFRPEEFDITLSDDQAQEQAAQMRNSVVVLGTIGQDLSKQVQNDASS